MVVKVIGFFYVKLEGWEIEKMEDWEGWLEQWDLFLSENYIDSFYLLSMYCVLVIEVNVLFNVYYVS